MRTEEEIREMLARCTDELKRAVAEIDSEPIKVKKVGDAIYQFNLRNIATDAAIGRHVLLWVLGETDIPPHL